MMVIEACYVAQSSSSSLLTSRRCLLWESRPCWLLFMAFFVLCFPTAMKSSRLFLDDVRTTRQPDGCILYGNFGSSVYHHQSFECYYGPGDVCPCSGSSFFQSASADFIGEEDDARMPSLKLSKGSGQTARNAAFKMDNGEFVSCSLTNSAVGIHHLPGFGNRSMAPEGVDFCDGSLFSDFCMKDSGEASNDIDEHLEEAEAGILIDYSSLPAVEISPPTLDWGTKNIYSPSLEILKLINKHNESVLNVYDIYSTNVQFSAYSFEKISVAPGGSALIPFVFLPGLLGSNSAQLVLQTSFGGFIIHAEGIATLSPYQVQPFVGFNISTGKMLSVNLSLYNPSNDMLHVKEITTWISISSFKENLHSTHISCKTDRMQKYFIQSNSPDEWFTLNNGELGSSRVDLRPHHRWEVQPYSYKAILELNLWPHCAGKVSGAICMKLGNSVQETETVILPIDIEVHERESYTDSTDFVSLHLDTVRPCNGNKTVFSMSLRNNASYLLKIVKIYEETRSFNIFKIRYSEGLLLFPRTDTQIALITYDHPIDTEGEEIDNHSAVLTCMLSIKTNDSVNPEMSIPCHDLVLSSCIYQSSFHNIEPEGSHLKLISKHKNEKCSSIGTLSENSNEELSPLEPKSLEITESDDMLLDIWRFQATTSIMSVLEDQEILFPVVQVGSHHSKWISVHNPSKKPVVMQLVLKLGAIVDHCKSSDDPASNIFMTESSHIDSTVTKVGFSMSEYAVTEAFVHPLESTLFGPVIFRPSNRCMWRSFALIRNNLSGVERLPLQAFGGSQALVILKDSLPIHRVDFELQELKTSNVSSIKSSNSFCSNLFSKELYAKNIGEFPLEVTKLKISGTDCGSDGFSIHSCKGFSLAPGESRKLLISYQSDFSTAVVHRYLELSMASGILVLPMKASVSVHIFDTCRKALFRSINWKLFLLLLCVSFILLHLMTRIVPRFNASDQKDARISRYSNSTNECHDNAEKKLGKGLLHHDKNDRLSPKLVNSTLTLEMPESCNLTVRVVRDKAKRRKRRSNGAGLAAKFDVSSSQSGNSTPSSPLSPNISTPKQVLPQSLVSCAEDQLKQLKNSKRQDFEVCNRLRKSESAKCSNRKWSSSDQGLSKPSLLPSATFPGPGMSTSSLFTSTSSIAPCARAPGSKLCKEETVKGDGNDAIMKDFTYDIWGNHFSEQCMSKLSSTSGVDSYSFFTRDLQSPLMMSVTRSTSPSLETSS